MQCRVNPVNTLLIKPCRNELALLINRLIHRSCTLIEQFASPPCSYLSYRLSQNVDSQSTIRPTLTFQPLVSRHTICFPVQSIHRINPIASRCPRNKKGSCQVRKMKRCCSACENSEESRRCAEIANVKRSKQ